VFSILHREGSQGTREPKLKVRPGEIDAAPREHAVRGESPVERQELLDTINARRVGDDSVGRTALENAIVAYGNEPDAAFEYERGEGRGDAWRLWLRTEADCPVCAHELAHVLDDGTDAERAIGLRCALALLAVCDELLVVGEVTDGVRAEIEAASDMGIPVRFAEGSW